MSEPHLWVTVEIRCNRAGTHYDWQRLMGTEPMELARAKKLVEQHKELDKKPPVGHYDYRILKLNGELVR